MGESSFKFNLDRPVAIMGFTIFLLGLALRLMGVTWGLPSELHHYSYHPDEDINWLYSQSLKPAQGKFTPSNYSYGTLYLTLERIATDVVSGYGGGPTQKDGSDLWAARGRFVLAGRILNCLFGATIGWVVVCLLWRRIGPWGAAAGGLACCFAPGMVVHSRFETVDILATLLASLSLYWSAKLVSTELSDRDGLKFACLAGLFAGMSAGTKYTGFLLIFAVAVCAWIGLRKLPATFLKSIAAAGLVMALTFVICTPGSVLDTEHFMKDFKYEAVHSSSGHGLVFSGTAPGFIYHLENLGAALGPLLMLLGLAGLVWAMYRKHAWLAGVVAFGIVYYILIGRAEVKFMRYVFPLIPVLACGFGWLVSRLHSHPDGRFKYLNVLSIVGLLGLDWGGLGGALRATQWMTGTDPRDAVAQELIQQKGSVGFVEDPWFYTPPIYPECGAWRAVPFDQRVLARESSPVPVMTVLDQGTVPVWDTRLLTDLKPQRIVFSSFEYDDLERLARATTIRDEDKDEVTRFKNFLPLLNRDYIIERQEGLDGPRIHDLMYIRPTIWVWKRKDASATPSNGTSTTSAPSAGQAITP